MTTDPAGDLLTEAFEAMGIAVIDVTPQKRQGDFLQGCYDHAAKLRAGSVRPTRQHRRGDPDLLVDRSVATEADCALRGHRFKPTRPELCIRCGWIDAEMAASPRAAIATLVRRATH